LTEDGLKIIRNVSR